VGAGVAVGVGEGVGVGSCVGAGVITGGASVAGGIVGAGVSVGVGTGVDVSMVGVGVSRGSGASGSEGRPQRDSITRSSTMMRIKTIKTISRRRFFIAYAPPLVTASIIGDFSEGSIL